MNNANVYVCLCRSQWCISRALTGKCLNSVWYISYCLCDEVGGTGGSVMVWHGLDYTSGSPSDWPLYMKLRWNISRPVGVVSSWRNPPTSTGREGHGKVLWGWKWYKSYAKQDLESDERRGRPGEIFSSRNLVFILSQYQTLYLQVPRSSYLNRNHWLKIINFLLLV